MPLVSVVIPNYNYGIYLGMALDSVLGQDMRDFEVLVIDNFSNDDSLSIVESRGDPRVKCVQFSNNGVIASSRNVGLELARGEFVAFLDSDDMWSSTKLSKQLANMKKNTFVSYHDLKVIGPGPSRRVRGYALGGDPLASLLTKGNALPLSSTLCRTQFMKDLGGFPQEMKFVGVEDYSLWLKAAHQGYVFTYVRASLGYYRIHTSVSSKLDSASRTKTAMAPYVDLLSNRQLSKTQGFLNYANAVEDVSASRLREKRALLMKVLRSGNRRFIWRAFVRLVWLSRR